MYGDASVKVRDGLLDTKVLQQVNGAGLQLWVPHRKAGFPLDQAALSAVFAALGVPLPATTPADHHLEGFWTSWLVRETTSAWWRSTRVDVDLSWTPAWSS